LGAKWLETIDFDLADEGLAGNRDIGGKVEK